MKKLSALCMVSLLVAVLALTGCSTTEKTEYYKNSDFISSEEYGIVYETTEKNLGWGSYQKNESELGVEILELDAGFIALSKSKDEFDTNVSRFKERLDILESNYALGYRGDEGDLISLKIADSRLGLPVFALLNVNSPLDVMIVSQLGDLKIHDIRSLNYSLNESSKYEISIAIPENKQEDYSEYLKSHIGEPLYLKIGDLTFSSVVMSEEMTQEQIVFDGFDFLGSITNESSYEYIMKLAKYVVENPSDDSFSMDFPKETEDDIIYKLPYITSVDEMVVSKVNELYSDVKFIREGIENNIRFHFEIDLKNTSVVSCLNRIYRIYDECDFDGGAYSHITFTWPSDKVGYNDYVSFSKKNGKMICTNYSDKIKKEVENDDFIKRYLEE